MEFKARIVTWKEIETWCENINKKMLNDFNPDTIIGMSRGGLVPARIIADMLVLKELYAIKTEHWGLTATSDGKASLKYGLNVSIEGKKVLIVDDITDTGQSMKLAHDYAMEQKPAELKTATLLHIGHSTFEPDYYSDFVDDSQWTWFIFPWNVYEDVSNLSSKIKEKNLQLEDVKKKLNELYDMNIDSEQLEKVLKQMCALHKATEKNGKYTFQ